MPTRRLTIGFGVGLLVAGAIGIWAIAHHATIRDASPPLFFSCWAGCSVGAGSVAFALMRPR